MNSSRKERLIEIARALSDKRTGRSFHVSFILNKNQILSIGHNNYQKGHPKARFGEYKARYGNDYNPGLHAEIAAITRLINNSHITPDFRRLTLFNVRIGFNSETMPARPCQNCQNVLDEFNFGTILWTGGN